MAIDQILHDIQVARQLAEHLRGIGDQVSTQAVAGWRSVAAARFAGEVAADAAAVRGTATSLDRVVAALTEHLRRFDEECRRRQVFGAPQ